MSEQTERRLVFGSVAEQYDRYRPAYPQQMVDDVLDFCGKAPEELHVLEVGAGTGKATRQFAPRVTHVTAIEPDAEMIAAAMASANAPANVTYLQGDFEHAELPHGGFDLLISATAWHWISTEARYPRALEVLAHGGVLAAFWNGPEWDASPLRAELADAYERSGANLPEHTNSVMHPGGPNRLQTNFGESWDQELAATPQFAEREVRTYSWTQDYTAQEYVGLLGTHSDHLMTAPEQRERLFGELTAVIDRSGGGVLELPYRTLLCLARKR